MLTEKLCNTLQGEELELFSKLVCLLFADDTIILADSLDELQVALNALTRIL